MDIIDEIFGTDEEAQPAPAPQVDEAEIDRRTWSSKSAVQHASDAAYCCQGRDPREVVNDARHVGEVAASEVWQLHLAFAALPGGDAAYRAYSQICAGNTELSAAATSASQELAEVHYDSARSQFEAALRTLGW